MRRTDAACRPSPCYGAPSNCDDPYILSSTLSHPVSNNYSGFRAAAYGTHTLPTADGSSQSSIAGSAASNYARILTYGSTPTYHSALPSITAPSAYHGITVYPGPTGYYTARFTNAVIGSGVLWLDPVNWRLLVNFSWDKTRTYNVPLKSTRLTPQSFWGKVGLVLGAIGLAISIVGLVAAVGTILAVTAPAVVTIGMTAVAVTAVAGIGVSIAAILAGICDQTNATPYLDAMTSPPQPYFNPMQPPDGLGIGGGGTAEFGITDLMA